MSLLVCMVEHTWCMISRVQYSASAAGFPTPVISLKDVRSPVKPFATMYSILNSTNKSNYIK